MNNDLSITPNDIQEAVRSILGKTLRSKHELITTLVEQALDDRLSDVVSDLMDDDDIQDLIRETVKTQILANVPNAVQNLDIEISVAT